MDMLTPSGLKTWIFRENWANTTADAQTPCTSQYHKHQWYWPVKINRSLFLWRRISTPLVISAWRDDTKHKLLIIFLQQNSRSPGLISKIKLASPSKTMTSAPGAFPGNENISVLRALSPSPVVFREGIVYAGLDNGSVSNIRLKSSSLVCIWASLGHDNISIKYQPKQYFCLYLHAAKWCNTV